MNLAYNGWLDQKLTFSPTLKITTPIIHLKRHWATMPTMFGEVIAEERTYDYYGSLHVESGYKAISNSLNGLIFTAGMCEENWSRIRFSAIRSRLQEILAAGAPDLSLTASDTLKNYVDVEVLCFVLLAGKIGLLDLKFLGFDMFPAEEQGYWVIHYSLNPPPETLRILLHTKDKGDQSRMNQCVQQALTDEKIVSELDGFANDVRAIQNLLAEFQTGLRDLVFGIKVGASILPECDVCREWFRKIAAS